MAQNQLILCRIINVNIQSMCNGRCAYICFSFFFFYYPCAYNSIYQWQIYNWQQLVLHSQLTILNDSEYHHAPSVVQLDCTPPVIVIQDLSSIPLSYANSVNRVMVENVHTAGSGPTACCTPSVRSKLGTFAEHCSVSESERDKQQSHTFAPLYSIVSFINNDCSTRGISH